MGGIYTLLVQVALFASKAQSLQVIARLRSFEVIMRTNGDTKM